MTRKRTNLIPNSERTPSERKQIARSGGIASGKARREKVSLRNELLEILEVETECPDGIKRTLRERISLALIEKAISGDVTAFKVIRETIGEDFPEVERPELVEISFGNMSVEDIALCVADIKQREEYLKRKNNGK